AADDSRPYRRDPVDHDQQRRHLHGDWTHRRRLQVDRRGGGDHRAVVRGRAALGREGRGGLFRYRHADSHLSEPRDLVAPYRAARARSRQGVVAPRGVRPGHVQRRRRREAADPLRRARMAHPLGSGATRSRRLFRRFLDGEPRAAARGDRHRERQGIARPLVCKRIARLSHWFHRVDRVVQCDYPIARRIPPFLSKTFHLFTAASTPSRAARTLLMIMRVLAGIFPMTQETGKRSYLFVLPWAPDIVSGVNGVVRNLAKAMDNEGSLEPSIAVDSWVDWTPRQLGDALHFRFSIFGALSP